MQFLNDDPDKKKVKANFDVGFNKLHFHELEKQFIKDINDKDIEARYCLTRAFLGKAEEFKTHEVEIKFDIDELKNAIKVYADGKKSDINVKCHYKVKPCFCGFCKMEKSNR